MKNVNLKKIVRTASLVTLTALSFLQEANAKCCMCINGDRAMRCINVYGPGAHKACVNHCHKYHWKFGGLNQNPC